MCQRCFTTYVWVKPLKDLIIKQINYEVIKEEEFTINLCNNG